MVTQRIEKAGTMLTFGYIAIVQIIVTGEVGYVSTGMLVKLGLGIGLCMVLGAGYALLVPPTWMRTLTTAMNPSASGTPSVA
jgi:hypothetical protein